MLIFQFQGENAPMVIRNIGNSKRVLQLFSLLFFAILLFTGCRQPSANSKEPVAFPGLVGAWRSNIQFQTGALAAVKDLEFLYVFNAGGTMTESSNYDGAPPVPPAYGIWKKVGDDEYELKYEFYMTRNPTSAESASGNVGWLPAGHGVLQEKIILSQDGNSFTSTIRYEAFDQLGKPLPGGDEGKGRGVRLRF
jgi:hypothetical protein